VPWHLATTEFADEIRRVLRPRGIYAVNVIDHPPFGLLHAEAATLLSAFEDVALVARRTREGAPAGGNVVLLASDAPLPRAAGSTARGARTDGRAALARLAAGADPLRDDDAPADQLITLR
jgi:spermidine synthase